MSRNTPAKKFGKEGSSKTAGCQTPAANRRAQARAMGGAAMSELLSNGMGGCFSVVKESLTTHGLSRMASVRNRPQMTQNKTRLTFDLRTSVQSVDGNCPQMTQMNTDRVASDYFNYGEFAIIKSWTVSLNPSNATGLESPSEVFV